MDDSLQDPPLPSFASVEEECAYWKARCSEIKQKLIETKQEFADFEDNSRQLEAELETVLEQREKTIQDLKHSLDQLQTDNESLRKRISSLEVDYNSMEKNHTELNKEFEQLREYTRKVEQKNDDLERANRVVAATVTDLEAMLNQAYEKNEFLELEVEDKESLTVKHQRVLDELRDLKQEMKVKPSSNVSNTTNTNEKPPLHSDNILNGNTPPIASQKAFNIIADSLRRIDIMAAKLKACQEIMPPNKIMMRDNLQEIMPTANQRRKQQPYITAVQKSASPSLRSLNGSLNASRLSVTNDMDETLSPGGGGVTDSNTPLRKTTAI